MTRRLHIRSAAVTIATALLIAGCGGGGAGETDAGSSSAANGDDSGVNSVLVIDGSVVDSAGASARPQRAAAERKAARTKPRRAVVRAQPWPELARKADGTLDAGPDPFASSYIPVQPIPIEDDPYTTKDIDAAASSLRRVDNDTWAQWKLGMGRSPWQQGEDPTARSIVEVTVERCGGARTVATGVVLANETVVTTVHAVENAAKRVWIAPAVGVEPRIAAMIQYLDVDDDVAVLRVPGLRLDPMLWYVAPSSEPTLGFAFGIGPGGRSGALRRVPVITSTQESSITVEQPDGLAQEITDRSVQTLVGGITTGFSGGVVAATNDPTLATNWGFHGLLRARVPFRSDTAGIVVPSRIVADALDANDRLDPWFEHRPGGCPQWHR